MKGYTCEKCKDTGYVPALGGDFRKRWLPCSCEAGVKLTLKQAREYIDSLKKK